MKHSDSIAKLSAALVKVAAEVKTIANDSTGDIPTKGGGKFSYRYAGLPKVTETLRPILAKHGIAVMQGTAPEPVMAQDGLVGAVLVETTLLHESGEFITTTVVIPISQATAQGAGSAITYGRRYGFLSAVGVSTDDDDDGAAASQPSERSSRTQAQDRPASNGNGANKGGNTWDGSVESAMATLVPFGKTKGKPLGELAPDALSNLVEWCRKTDEKKFADLIARAEAVLSEKGVAVGAKDGDDDLPF